MKNCRNLLQGFPPRSFLKFLLFMKLTALFLLIPMLHVYADGHGQERFSLSLEQVEAGRVFTQIQKESNYRFFYLKKDIQKLGRVNVHVKDATLPEVMQEVLGNALAYKLVNEYMVVISPSKAELEQQVEVRGRVTDENGSPLEGVSIKIKGKTIGVTTGTDGSFSIVAENNDVLEITMVGYESREITIGGNADLGAIVLKVASSGLEEVVVVGYGTQKKVTLTGAVATVRGEEITKSPVLNVSNSLSGRLPGVTAVTRNSEPGSDGATIRIRGSNTLGNNGALIVVDGIPDRSLERIDPNSIESVTVLKDASAAIYGSQAANGVILITTKRGKSGRAKTVVNVSKGFTQPTRIPKMTNAAQYATALNELDQYAGAQPRFSEEDIQKFSDGTDPWGHPNTDWFAAVLKDWSNQLQGNVNISGGGEFMRYFVSLGAKTQDAYYKKSATKYNQYDFRTNLDINLTKDKNVSLAVDVVGRLENSNFPGRTGRGTDIFFGLLKGKPNMPAYWPNGLPGPDIERGENPVALATNMTGFTDNKTYVLNTNLKLNVKVPWIEGLTLTGNAAFDKGVQFNKNFQQPWYLYSWDGQSYDANNEPELVRGKKGIDDPNLTQYVQDDFGYLLNALINYKKSIGLKHDIGFLIGAEARKGTSDNFNAYRRYFVSPSLPQLNMGGTNALTNGGSASHNARLNYFGRVNYDYLEKYLIEFVWRVDGSYIFPEAGRYGFFPGASVGWRLSEEEFWKDNLSAISDNVKLRLSYGETGNDRIDPYQYISSYGFNSRNYILNITNEVKALLEQRIPNPNVTWEVAKQTDIGLDVGFIKNKLLLTVDYFDYRRSNILWLRNASVPSSTGLTLPRENIGKVRNSGFDFDLSYRRQDGEFNYTVFLNGGYSKNKITFWDESPGAPEYQKSTGHPMPTDPNNPGNDLYYQAIGIFRDQDAIDKYPHWPGARPGDVIFKDVNEDGVINANDRMRSNKNDIPTFTGGLGFEAEYKNFDFSVLFQGATGAVRYLRLEAAGNFGNYLLSDFKDRWTPDNIDGTKPRMFDRTDQFYRSERSTYLLHKTDYVRLKNIEIGYNIPYKLKSRINIENFRVFVSGYNLLTLSPDLKDFDPEDNNQGSANYPPQRIISVGLSVNF